MPKGRLTNRLAGLLSCLSTLAGCASTLPAMPPPDPVRIPSPPVRLAPEHSRTYLPQAQDLSQRAQTWLEQVQRITTDAPPK
jgi:hypothetical protein